MYKYCEYDAENKVIIWSLKDTPPDFPSQEEAFAEIIALADSLPEKPYLLVDWTDFVLENKDRVDYYRKKNAELIKHVKGLVRFNVHDLNTRIELQKSLREKRLEDARFFLYSSKEAALEAIRKGEIK
jgi:hypothetical protein